VKGRKAFSPADTKEETDRFSRKRFIVSARKLFIAYEYKGSADRPGRYEAVLYNIAVSSGSESMMVLMKRKGSVKDSNGIL
jgi:hypothetical protein